jgi:predicted AAA+ superfamily ATPase
MQAFDGDKYEGWAEYVVYGGMPLTLSMQTDEQKSRYLERLFAETYLKDVIERNGIIKTEELENLVDVLASSIGALTNPPKIAATFKSVLKSNISTNTLTTFIGYLEDSFLIEKAQRFDVKGRKYIGSPVKYYFEDMGLRNARLGFRQIEETHIMENIIYNELRTRGYSVDVGSVEKAVREDGKVVRKNLEVDFVANLGSKRTYIQSALHLSDSQKESQEKRPLIEIPDSFEKIVLVRDVVKPTYDNHGILTMSIYDFLLTETTRQ